MCVSGLAVVTVEAVSTGKISISCKGKHREIYLIPKLSVIDILAEIADLIITTGIA